MKLLGTLYVAPTEENTCADTRLSPSKIRNHDLSVCAITGNVSYRNSVTKRKATTYNLVVRFHPRFTIKTTCSGGPQHFLRGVHDYGSVNTASSLKNAVIK